VLEPYDFYSLFGGGEKQGSDVFYFENTDSFKGRLSNFISKLLVPDTKIGWYPFGVRVSKRIFKENDIAGIFSTSPKMTAHLIARTVHKKYQVPWVADFRDPWTGWEEEIPTFFKGLNEHLERMVISEADVVTSVMEEITEDFKKMYKDVNPKKFVTICHGFDSADFEGVRPKEFSNFTIIYLGTFYKGRDPQPLLKALHSLVNDNNRLREEIQVIFVGNEYQNTKRMVAAFNLEDMVVSIPHVPYKESLRYLMGADLCYFNTVTTRNALPVKLFDYIASQKPILAIIPEESPVAKVIHETESGVVIAPEKTGKIKETLLSFYNEYKKGGLKLKRDNDSIVYKYEREAQARQLAEVLTDISK
jgi:glycosyltransferase involved in cell wall biosynthesis